MLTFAQLMHPSLHNYNFLRRLIKTCRHIQKIQIEVLAKVDKIYMQVNLYF